MVGRGEAEIGAADRSSAPGQPPERGGRALVEQVAIDIEEHVPARAFGHHVPGPDLLEHRARRCRRCGPSRGWGPAGRGATIN